MGNEGEEKLLLDIIMVRFSYISYTFIYNECKK